MKIVIFIIIGADSQRILIGIDKVIQNGVIKMSDCYFNTAYPIKLTQQ